MLTNELSTFYILFFALHLLVKLRLIWNAINIIIIIILLRLIYKVFYIFVRDLFILYLH